LFWGLVGWGGGVVGGGGGDGGGEGIIGTCDAYFAFLYNFVSEKFLILRRTEGDTVINIIK